MNFVYIKKGNEMKKLLSVFVFASLFSTGLYAGELDPRLTEEVKKVLDTQLGYNQQSIKGAQFKLPEFTSAKKGMPTVYCGLINVQVKGVNHGYEPFSVLLTTFSTDPTYHVSVVVGEIGVLYLGNAHSKNEMEKTYKECEKAGYDLRKLL